MLFLVTMILLYNTGLFSLSILQVIQIQILKRGKKKGPHFCTRLYDLFLKVYFSESWFLVLFQFMKTWKTRQKCFFPSRGKHVFSLKLLSRLPLKGFFIEWIKKIWSILWTLSKEKSKQVFIMASFHFQNQTNLNKI